MTFITSVCLIQFHLVIVNTVHCAIGEKKQERSRLLAHASFYTEKLRKAGAVRGCTGGFCPSPCLFIKNTACKQTLI